MLEGEMILRPGVAFLFMGQEVCQAGFGMGVPQDNQLFASICEVLDSRLGGDFQQGAQLRASECDLVGGQQDWIRRSSFRPGELSSRGLCCPGGKLPAAFPPAGEFAAGYRPGMAGWFAS